MADSQLIGNLVVGIVPSVPIWTWMASQWLTGRTVVPLRTREPCPWHPLAVWLAFPISMLVHAVVLTQFKDGIGPPLARVQAACLAMVLESLLMMAVLAMSAPIRAADFGIDRGYVPTDVMIGFLGFTASWAPVFAVNKAVDLLGWRARGGTHSYFKILEGNSGPEMVAWIGLSVVVLAPLAEELLYRVILQGWFETRMPPRSAILFVSALFAIVHYEPGRPDAIPLFPLALILGYVYYRLHSYLAVVILHAAFNGANLALALMMQG